MPEHPPQPVADLHDFLITLRFHGVPVGPTELHRLRQLFALEPALDRRGLHTLLSALLIKTPEQRDLFEALFADWCPEHADAWLERPATPMQERAARAEPQMAPPPEARPTRRWRRRKLAFAGCVGLFCLGMLWWSQTRPIRLEAPVSVQIPAAPLPTTGNSDPDDLPDTPVDSVWFWRAEVDTAQIIVPTRLGPLELAALGLGALGLAAWLVWHYRQRFRLRPPPDRLAFGPTWQPLPPPAHGDRALMAGREQRQMVWHIEQFATAEPSPHLDLEKTVEATAQAGGLVHLHYTPAVYPRAVWCWLDRQMEDVTPRLAVQQVLAALTAAGLEARQGWFTAVPDRVDWPAQAGYQPLHEEGPGRQAMVAIFTDGQGLARRLANPLTHAATARVLRSLRRWPRLCVVDCARQATPLARTLAPYGLQIIALDEVARWLGGQPGRPEPASPLGATLYGTARLWAAALALGGPHLDTASAQSLRLALDLAVSPWQVESVLALARDPAQRIPLLNWLLHSEPLGAHGRLAPGSVAQRALIWWQARYRVAAQRLQAHENPLLPWEASLASRRWQVEQALLLLYSDPENAVTQLVSLADATLGADIRAHLAVCVAADTSTDGHALGKNALVLPWRVADLLAETRSHLRQLGFAAGEQSPAAPLYPPRLAFAASLLAVLGVLTLGSAVYRWGWPAVPLLVAQEAVLDHPVLAAQTVRLREPLADGSYRVTLGSARETLSLPRVPAGAQVPVTWRWHQAAPNAVQMGDSVLLRAGRLAQPIRACAADWPQRVLVVLATAYATDRAARQLAIRLLDQGSADQVLVGTDWATHFDAWLGPSLALQRATQVLVLLPDAAAAEPASAHLARHRGPWAVASSDNFLALAQTLQFHGRQDITQLAAPLRLHATQGQVWLSGSPRHTSSPSGITWVHLCPGTFSMGTLPGEDAMADADEQPESPRTVVLSAFAMALTETTQQQMGETGQTPVVGSRWEAARAFCQGAGGDLPTEAQWEYAARAGSRFPWSFGREEAQLTRYAWFGGNADNRVQVVQQKRPNPFGLYDMHGNVWEWTRDWYGAYTSGVFVDSAGLQAGTCPEAYQRALGVDPSTPCRVIRGGSAWYPPLSLRSALRRPARGPARLPRVPVCPRPAPALTP